MIIVTKTSHRVIACSINLFTYLRAQNSLTRYDVRRSDLKLTKRTTHNSLLFKTVNDYCYCPPCSSTPDSSEPSEFSIRARAECARNASSRETAVVGNSIVCSCTVEFISASLCIGMGDVVKQHRCLNN